MLPKTACVMGKAAALLAALTMAFSCSLAADKPAPAPPSGAIVVARSMVRVAFPDVFFTDKFVSELMATDQVTGAAAREVLGPAAVNTSTSGGPAGAPRYAVFMESLSFRREAFGTVGLGTLEVQIENVTASKAPELLEAVVPRLRAALSQAGQLQLSDWRGQMAKLNEEFAEREVQVRDLQQLQQELTARAGETELSRSAVLRRIQELQQRRQQLQTDLVIGEAFVQALQERIAELGASARNRLEHDVIAAELEKILAARSHEYERYRLLAKEGKASQAEVTAAEVRLAEAKIQLAERRTAVSSPVGGELLNKLNEDLVKQSVQLSGKKAGLKIVEEQLERTRGPELPKLADDYDNKVRYALPIAQEALRRLMEQREALARQIRSYAPPSVTIIGAEPGKAGQ